MIYSKIDEAGVWGVPNNKHEDIFGGRSVFQNIQRDILKHCLPRLSEISDSFDKQLQEGV